MSERIVTDTHFHARVRSGSAQLSILGLLLIALGIVAIVFPFLATVVVTLLVGWIFLFGGACMFFGAFSIHGTGPFFGALLFSLIAIAAGVFFLFNPLGGAVTLTLVIGVLLMFQGAFELIFAFEMRPHSVWLGMMASALASIMLALIIVAGWPQASAVVLGVLLGVNFLTTGIGYLAVSRAMSHV